MKVLGRICSFIISCLSESLSSLLWNLHKYYSQFSDCIQTRISQLRQPIEKDLKVFTTVPPHHMLVPSPAFYMLTEAPLWSQLSSGLCQDLQMEWCQFLVNQTVGGKDPSVRFRAFLSCDSNPAAHIVPAPLYFLFPSQDSLQVSQEVWGGSERSLSSCTGRTWKPLQQHDLGHLGPKLSRSPHPTIYPQC